MRTVGCDVVIERLLAYMQGADVRPEDVAAAVDHMKTCLYCERRAGHLIRALRADERDELVCQECEERLPEYVEAIPSGHSDDAGWRAVKRHLETCPHCSELFVDLKAMLALAEGWQGVEPPEYPTPDLSFLRPKRARKPTSRLEHWDALGRLVIALSDELLQSLRPPRTAFAAAGRKTRGAGPALWQYELADAGADLKVILTAEQARDDPSRCSVAVVVDIPSRGGWPNLAGSEVTLQRGDQEPETRATDAFGKAIFAGIAAEDLPRLVFTIHPVSIA